MNIENIKKIGINYDQGVHRFGGNPNLYKKYVLKFLDDTTFSQLKQAMSNQKFNDAFIAAHTLKGIVGNLSFNNFFSILNPFVECLRDNSNIAYAQTLFPTIEKEYSTILNAITEEFNG